MNNQTTTWTPLSSASNFLSALCSNLAMLIFPTLLVDPIKVRYGVHGVGTYNYLGSCLTLIYEPD